MWPSWRNIHKIDHHREKMDKSSRLGDTKGLSKESLVAAIALPHCGNVNMALGKVAMQKVYI